VGKLEQCRHLVAGNVVFGNYPLVHHPEACLLKSLIGASFIQIAGAGCSRGLALKFVAWLLKEAQELQEEQELTV